MTPLVELPPQVVEEIVHRAGRPDFNRWSEKLQRCGYCSRPVRLRGRVVHQSASGRRSAYSTDGEPDRVLMIRCGNRRSAVCPSCSYEYAGDMWQLLYAGAAGGRKGVPESIRSHPLVFATLTAPGFGPVHTTRTDRSGPARCRPARDTPRLCPHGRRSWCLAIHNEDDPRLGQPICPDCYDYPGHVAFNWHAPELWRRFTIAVRRALARTAGLTASEFSRRCRVSFVKVAEFQRRGVVHFHALIRLDGPGEDYQPPPLSIDATGLAEAIRQAAAHVRLTVEMPDGPDLVLRFGEQLDTQTVNGGPAGELTPEHAARYIAKYSTKSADDFGVGQRRITPEALPLLRVTDHVDTLVRVAWQLGEHPAYEGLRRWVHMLGFRGQHRAVGSIESMVTAAGQGLGLAGRVTGRYTRISDDTEHAARGVGRQDQDETAYIEAAGGVVGPLYEENDTSAYQKKRIRLPDGMIVYRVLRPVWQRMLADLRAGVITAACVADLDRLARDPRDLEDAIEVVEHYRRPIVGVRGGFDLVTDNGRFAARILVAQANKSSADTAARVARKHVEQQQQGIPTGGRRPFGWKPDKRTLEPGEATELRLAVQRITAGWSVGAVVMDFNTRGVRPTRATEWVGSSLVGLLRNPRLCGLRARTVAEFDPDSGVTQHHLEIVVHPDGTPVVGQWEPLISVPEWEAVNAALASRAKTPAPRPIGHNAWKYLLSGFLRCGECGKPMRGMSNASRTAAKRYPLFVYSCQSQAAGGCGRVARHGPRTDLHVVEAVLARVELELAQATEQVGPWPGEAALAEVSADIAELTAAWKATPKRISSARYFALLPDLEAAERRLLAERGKHGLAAEVALHRPADIRGEWPDYPLSRKRSIIEGELRAVIVYKATRRGAPFDPDRLELVWKTD